MEHTLEIKIPKIGFYDGIEIEADGRTFTLARKKWDFRTVSVSAENGKSGFVDLALRSNGEWSHLEDFFPDDREKQIAFASAVRSMFPVFSENASKELKQQYDAFACHIESDQQEFKNFMKVCLNRFLWITLDQTTCTNGLYVNVFENKHQNYGYVDVYPGSDGSSSDLSSIVRKNRDLARILITWIRSLFGLETHLSDEQIKIYDYD